MQVHFRKKPWQGVYSFSDKKVTVLDEIWEMYIDHSYLNINKNEQYTVAKFLASKFDTIRLISPTSKFFYFESEEDEAQFLLLFPGIDVPDR